MSKSIDLFDKHIKFDYAKKIQSAGVYPYFRPIEETCGSSVTINGKRRVMIGSNNYLGLTHHPRVQEASKRAIDRFGTGCTGSRFLNGNLTIHEELEQRLAKFLGKEDCIVFATGFLANQGALSCLMGRNDVIYCDRENHASIIEGTRVAISDTVKFKHNDIEDLERVLEKTRNDYEGALIVADGIFSMSGDILNLPEISRVAKKFNCRVYVDDAHALGVLGPKGQGTEAHFNMLGAADLVMGTFSKSFAALGGYVAGDKDAIHFIKHKARTFMFSAAMTPASVGAVLECLNIVEEEPQHLQNLWKNSRKMKLGLERMGFNTMGSQTPIIPLLIGEPDKAFYFTQKLYENGVFATPVVQPAVPAGFDLIRTSYMASHTDEDLDYALDVLESLGRQFGVLGKESDCLGATVSHSKKQTSSQARV
jgi:8-amino-7-oxononanoate synthase